MSTSITRSILWEGTYKTTKVRIVEVVHSDNVISMPDGDVTIPGLISRLVEMSLTQDTMGADVWSLTEFDADMLLYFLFIHPSEVKPLSADIGQAATVAADRIASAAPVVPEA